MIPCPNARCAYPVAPGEPWCPACGEALPPLPVCRVLRRGRMRERCAERDRGRCQSGAASWCRARVSQALRLEHAARTWAGDAG
jgi:hypothetical protein